MHKERIENYFQSNDLNISTLRLVFNPRVLKKRLDGRKDDDEKRHFRIGGAIDTILTQDMETFRQHYFVAPKNRPSGMMGIFIDNLPLDLDDNSPEEKYQEAYEIAGYKWPIKSAIDSMWKNEEYKSYYLSRKLAEEKSILTYDEFEEVMHAQKELMGSPFTRDYFLNNKDHIEIIYQVPIYFVVDGIRSKALLDGIMIDHKNKWITIFDLKTIGKPLNKFKYSFLDYGYYLQAGWYTKAVKQLIDHKNWKVIGDILMPEKAWVDTKISELNHKFKELYDYQIKDFQFIVAETKPFYQNPAQIFEVDNNQLNKAWTGGYHNNKYYEGINRLLDTYKWHVEMDYWDMPKELYLNQGKVKLDLLT